MLEYHSQVPDYPDCDPMLMALVRVIALLRFNPIIYYHSTSPCRDLAVCRKFLGRLSLISLALFCGVSTGPHIMSFQSSSHPSG
jgi:hypothetical protein